MDQILSQMQQSPSGTAPLDLKSITEIIYKQNAELVKLDKLKDEFVSLTSHELRTPLTIIKNYLWLVMNKADMPLGPQTQKHLMTATRSVDRLMALIEDMLTVSRLQGNRMSLKREATDLSKLLQDVLDEMNVKIEEKSLQLVTKVPYRRVMLSLDIERMRQVLVNLISNAIKFSPDRSQITVGLVERDREVYVIVQDHGPGIPKEKQNQLFTKFGKIDESYVKLPNTHGTGLGLYISQEIVKLHGGRIDVVSEYGKGATFVVRLPV